LFWEWPDELEKRGGVVGDRSVLNATIFSGRVRMNRHSESVFDLSPAEKLQLVEDLWDDLAANPEDVPLHDWQIKKLERRKANLARHPASGLSWEEVQRKIRDRHGR
jgi:putative addiction module component (TIGR02574 family)